MKFRWLNIDSKMFREGSDAYITNKILTWGYISVFETCNTMRFRLVIVPANRINIFKQIKIPLNYMYLKLDKYLICCKLWKAIYVNTYKANFDISHRNRDKIICLLSHKNWYRIIIANCIIGFKTKIFCLSIGHDFFSQQHYKLFSTVFQFYD